MKILRSILAVVLGVVASMLAITLVHAIGERIYPPPQELVEQFRLMSEGKEMDRDKVRELLQSMPLGALCLVVLAWASGSFVGGALAALIAGRARCVHAGVIGVAVLAATVANFLMLQGHPNWMILAGLLMPMPISLLAGKIVSLLLPSASAESPTVTTP